MENSISTTYIPKQSISRSFSKVKPKSLTHAQRLNELYQFPAPFRTFPLPNFVPHNPLSLFHVLYTWLSQILKPTISRITPVYEGLFSPETRSVHVTDTRAIRGLWEQGFYGKGSLSRSEPNWLDGERARRENKAALTSEELTRKRRTERQKQKWERARKEMLAIDQQLSEEAKANDKTSIAGSFISQVKVSGTATPVTQSMPELNPAVGPIELLSLPNSQSDLDLTSANVEETIALKTSTLTNSIQLHNNSFVSTFNSPQNSKQTYKDISCALKTNYVNEVQKFPAELMTPNYCQKSSAEKYKRNSHLEKKKSISSSSEKICDVRSNYKILSQGRKLLNTIIENCKSFRFFSGAVKDKTNLQKLSDSSFNNVSRSDNNENLMIREEEHLQLTFEEAFFLSYSLGCLHILDPVTKSRISTQSLYKLYRQFSSFPPLIEKLASPDNSFIINYVVYHHFRSLGWVVRSGIKFSVDYMLYNRGPVFSHAEFAVLILPTYSDPYWTSTAFLTEYSRKKQHRTWAWMSCINRVISQVKKTLVLCYVDIPPPLAVEDEECKNLDVILARYKLREFILGRFLTNRMRAR